MYDLEGGEKSVWDTEISKKFGGGDGDDWDALVAADDGEFRVLLCVVVSFCFYVLFVVVKKYQTRLEVASVTSEMHWSPPTTTSVFFFVILFLLLLVVFVKKMSKTFAFASHSKCNLNHVQSARLSNI
jgi:hypothetical protein